MIIKNITYKEVLPIWKNFLWPERKTEIKPNNPLKFMGGYDKLLLDSIPTFFGAFVNNKCIGVNSGFATSSTEYRSRGIYVFSEYRRQGISQMLFGVTEEQAIKEKRNILWSVPRVSSLKAYEKFGFDRVSDFFDDMEFGPNCFVVKKLSDSFIHQNYIY
jgi:GNAT superfamily N-acetyltransferase